VQKWNICRLKKFDIATQLRPSTKHLGLLVSRRPDLRFAVPEQMTGLSLPLDSHFPYLNDFSMRLPVSAGQPGYRDLGSSKVGFTVSLPIYLLNTSYH
jgi:hypothetical protein